MAFFVLSAGTAGAEDGKSRVFVNAYVDRSAVNIGEKVKYTIEIDTEKSAGAEFPDSGGNFGGFVVSDFGEEKPCKSGPDSVKRLRWYLLDTYTAGSYVIPPGVVRVTLDGGVEKELKTPEIFVEVESLLDKEGKKQELRDIKPVLSLPGSMRFLLLALLFLLLLSGGGMLGMVLFRRCNRPKAVPPRKAHEIALEELGRIQAMGLVEKGQAREYTFLVSGCLRFYIENRFGVKAPAETTEEFLESATRSDFLERRWVGILKEYLELCDLVKYAKLDPSADETARVLETTRRFVNETREREAAAA